MTTLRPAKFIYVLQHQYTESSLSLSLLKEDDLRRGLALQEPCRKTKCHLFLGAIENSRERLVFEKEFDDGPKEIHEIGQVTEEDTYMTAVYDTDGYKILNRTSIELDDEDNEIIQEDWFDEDEPDSEDYHGYQGNSCFTTHYFCKEVRTPLSFGFEPF